MLPSKKEPGKVWLQQLWHSATSVESPGRAVKHRWRHTRRDIAYILDLITNERQAWKTHVNVRPRAPTREMLKILGDGYKNQKRRAFHGTGRYTMLRLVLL